MNLYKLHSNPEELDYHDLAHEKIPFLFWDKYKNNRAELKKREDQIAKDAYYSYLYAIEVLQAPFPKGEDAISKDAHYSYYYAVDVLNAPFPKGENAIAKDAKYSRFYATDVLKLSDEEAGLR